MKKWIVIFVVAVSSLTMIGFQSDSISKLRSMDEADHHLELSWRQDALVYISVTNLESFRRIQPLIKGSDTVETLIVQFCKLEQSDFDVVLSLSQIKHLHIAGSSFAPRWLQSIDQLTRLEQLGLRLAGLRTTDLSYLARAKTVVKLDISDNEITSIDKLAELELPQLRWLEINSNPIDDEGFKPIQKMTQLISVGFLKTKVTVEGCKAAAPLLGLLELGMPNMSFKEQREVKAAFDEERRKAIEAGKEVLPVDKYPFAYLEVGFFKDRYE